MACFSLQPVLCFLLSSQVQVMIKREVNSALKESTDELQSLTETVQKMDSGVDYESLLQNLEVSKKKRKKGSLCFACD